MTRQINGYNTYKILVCYGPRKLIAIITYSFVTFRLNAEQIKLLKETLSPKRYELINADVPNELISNHSVTKIIIASALDETGKEMLFAYYNAKFLSIDETIYWLGYPKPPHPLRARFICDQNFEALIFRLKQC